MRIKGEVRQVSQGTTKAGKVARFYRVLEEGAAEFTTVYEGAAKDGTFHAPPCAEAGEVVEFEVRQEFVFLGKRLDVAPALKAVDGKRAAL